MRLRNVKNKEKILSNCDVLINDAKMIKGSWKADCMRYRKSKRIGLCNRLRL